MVHNGKGTGEWLTREDSASPTAAHESIMLMAIIDAKEGRDVMTCDIPNAFIQTEMPSPEEGKERVMMRIAGVLVDMLVQQRPGVQHRDLVDAAGQHIAYSGDTGWFDSGIDTGASGDTGAFGTDSGLGDSGLGARFRIEVAKARIAVRRHCQ